MDFYTRAPGSRVIMPSGKPLVFTGGLFSTEDKAEIAELEYLVKEGYLSKTPVPLVKDDSVVLKEVGAPKAGGTGMVNSATVAALSSSSDASS